MKWKNEGLIYELQEKCFKGTIATGFACLMPYQDPPLNEEDNHGMDIEDNQPSLVDDDDEDSDEGGDNTQPPMVPTSSNMNAEEKDSGKRREKGRGSKKA